MQRPNCNFHSARGGKETAAVPRKAVVTPIKICEDLEAVGKCPQVSRPGGGRQHELSRVLRKYTFVAHTRLLAFKSFLRICERYLPR